jgi:hypothetical protein
MLYPRIRHVLYRIAIPGPDKARDGRLVSNASSGVAHIRTLRVSQGYQTKHNVIALPTTINGLFPRWLMSMLRGIELSPPRRALTLEFNHVKGVIARKSNLLNFKATLLQYWSPCRTLRILSSRCLKQRCQHSRHIPPITETYNTLGRNTHRNISEVLHSSTEVCRSLWQNDNE